MGWEWEVGGEGEGVSVELEGGVTIDPKEAAVGMRGGVGSEGVTRVRGGIEVMSTSSGGEGEMGVCVDVCSLMEEDGALGLCSGVMGERVRMV